MKKVNSYLAVFSIALLLTGCNQKHTEENVARAVFYLEGGICQNNKEKVSYVYSMEGKETTYIVDPNELKEDDITRYGYTLQGWYRTKTVDGDKVTYTDKWDFEIDQMTKDGVTLYAYWIKNVVHTYDLYYINEESEEVLLGSYIVHQGEKFEDYLNYANKRIGYTSIGFFDENGNVWNNTFTHPGGDEDVNVKVYTRYIEGDYGVVSNLSTLRRNTSKNRFKS